jgi:MoaA/NifB/PqqE/SkfB family radical SAM enzyme
MKPQQLSYLAAFGLKSLVFRQRKPIIAGMPLTDVCNLHCKHCVVANVGRGHYPWARIEQTLRHFYDIGVRIMYLQGGEIMTWRDADRDVNDVIRLARRIGFFKVACVTNGTLGVATEADLMWVSLDGSKPVHDAIRGEGVFDVVMRNLEATPHPRVALNMTINRVNAAEVEAVADIAGRLPTVHGVSFNFHTPYPGVEEMSLPMTERPEVIDRIARLKRQGLPVLNTYGGLKAMRENKWRRPVPFIHLMEQDRIYECCFGRDQPGVCEKCGYGVIAELSQIMSGNIPTIVESISLFK